MVMMVPQYVVTFALPNPSDNDTPVHWILNGEDELTSLFQILMWNGIRTYSVRPYDFENDSQLSRTPR